MGIIIAQYVQEKGGCGALRCYTTFMSIANITRKGAAVVSFLEWLEMLLYRSQRAGRCEEYGRYA